ncbi:transcription antiterminator [Paraliobacillus sp. JSM ZJ581]|uniref:BglG family transcription antiterminator n=1 Tax=Paraliobacillus sp. JSM ZJ581 TaxID=3342118 RepID=UPI0035A98F9D
MLTKRQKEIVTIFINEDNPILIKDLACKFSVSIRTIKSDIKKLKSWLETRNITVYSKPNKGVWLGELEEKEKLEVHQKILMEPVDDDIWGVEGRVKRIILLLSLHPDKYITADYLANQLLVSINTVYKDIKRVDKLLDENDLHLSRYPRKGYAMIGSEVDIRQYTESLLTRTIMIDEQRKKDSYKHLKSDLLELSNDMSYTVELVSEELSRYDDNNIGYKPTTIEYLTLFIRLFIALSRIRKGNRIQNKGQKWNGYMDLSCTKFSSYAYNVTENVFQTAGCEVDTSEFHYIYRNALHNNEVDSVIELTNNIISYVSENLSIPFYEDSKLHSNLLVHLSSRFTEEHAVLLEKNPFMESLKADHPLLVQYVRNACEKYLFGRQNVPSEMISSFIALHFLVSLETTFSYSKLLKALYVCASGRGVARVVKNRLEKEIPQVRVVQYCGMDEVEEVIHKQKFDLVISVFPIHIDIPTVWVESVPTQKNIEEVKKQVFKLSGGEYIPVYSAAPSSEESNDPEVISRDIIIKSMELYVSLKEAFKGRIKERMEDAFLMHIFFMVHRLRFGMEYDYLVNTSFSRTDDYHKIDELFCKYNINASPDEKKAILFYIEKGEK